MKKPFIIVAAVSAAMLLAMLALFLLDFLHVEVQPRAAAQPFDAAGTVGGFDAAQGTEIASTAKYIEKVFRIPDGELPPEPKSACFGSTYNTADIQALIEKSARLLDGQKTFWSPDIELMPGEPISYYCDESILVIAWKEAINGCGCSFVEVRLADGSQLRRKLCRDGIAATTAELESMTASEMAAEDNAVVAVDGDFYTRRWRGIRMKNGEFESYAPSAVHTCLFTADGDMLFLRGNRIGSEDEVKDFIRDNNVKFTVNFGPVLVENYELQDINPEYIYGEVSDMYSRCAIGQRGKLHYLLMTVSNEQEQRYHSCTAYQEAQFIYDKGVERAYALDGGHTTTITMGGSAYNRPDYGFEKQISDIICFASADRADYG